MIHIRTLTNIVLIFLVIGTKQRQQLYLSPCLHQEWFFALDDLDSHFFVSLLIQRLNNLTERTLSYSFL
jgi:hypothetical protein